MSEFVAIEETADPSAIEAESYALLEAQFAGWTPAEGNLETWLIKAFARISSAIFDQASLMSRAAFKKFGESVVAVPPILAAPASVESKWTMIDNAGYTVPLGTQVVIAGTGDISYGFVTAEEKTVPPGSTTTTILLEAIEPGEDANGLTADPILSDALAFVDSIESEGTSANGVDEEEEDDYLDRLVDALQLLSLSLIVGRDFEIDARAVAGIHRAKALEAFNAEKGASGEAEALAVSIYPVDEDGQKLSAGVKEELQERQQAKVPSGVDVYVDDPAYTKLKVKATFKVLEGFDPEAVEAAVKARLQEYLDPANWGLPAIGDPAIHGGWVNRTTVYRFELLSEVDRVGGVDRVVSLELAKEADALGTADIALTGPVSLTEAGTITSEAV